MASKEEDQEGLRAWERQSIHLSLLKSRNQARGKTRGEEKGPPSGRISGGPPGGLSPCHELNVHVSTPPPSSHVDALILHTVLVGGGLWEVLRVKLVHEGGALVTELAPSHGHSKEMASYKPGREFTRPWICWHLDLGLPASRTVRNQYWLFKPSSVWFSVKAAQVEEHQHTTCRQ